MPTTTHCFTALMTATRWTSRPRGCKDVQGQITEEDLDRVERILELRYGHDGADIGVILEIVPQFTDLCMRNMMTWVGHRAAPVIKVHPAVVAAAKAL